MRRAASPLHDDAADQAPPGGAFPPDLHDTHHLRLKAFLLIVWVVFSFGACYFARDLQTLVPDWPLAYWLASQGAVLVFLAIVVAYCLAMDRFERRERADGPDGDSTPHG